MFLSNKNNNEQKNGTAVSFFLLKINPLQVPDDVTDE